MGIKDRKYNSELKKILRKDNSTEFEEVKVNPSKDILILFEGTSDLTRHSIINFANGLKKSGKNVKLLSFINSKGKLVDFGMAVYNNSSVNWYGFPKKHILQLLETQKFDVLLNLNFQDRNHLHALACKAKADFKISFPTKYNHNFTMIVNTKEKEDPDKILDEINNCLRKLTI